MKLIFIGHSHTGMFRRAAGIVDGGPTIGHIRFRKREVDAAAVRAKLMKLLDLPVDATSDDVARIAEDDDVRFMMCVGGNAHFYIAHREQTPPIDFVHPPYSTEVDPDRQFVPVLHITRLIESRLARQLAVLPDIEFPPARTLALSSPPPAADNSYVASALATRLDESADEIPIAPPRLRMAAWDINRQLTRAYWQERGITFVEPHKAVVDASGFLRRRGYVPDNSTHTNVWYGRSVLRNLTFDDGYQFTERDQA